MGGPEGTAGRGERLDVANGCAWRTVGPGERLGLGGWAAAGSSGSLFSGAPGEAQRKRMAVGLRMLGFGRAHGGVRQPCPADAWPAAALNAGAKDGRHSGPA